jgi:hypothetical protein
MIFFYKISSSLVNRKETEPELAGTIKKYCFLHQKSNIVDLTPLRKSNLKKTGDKRKI